MVLGVTWYGYRDTNVRGFIGSGWNATMARSPRVGWGRTAGREPHRPQGASLWTL